MSWFLKHYKLAEKPDTGQGSVGRSLKAHGEDTYHCPESARSNFLGKLTRFYQCQMVKPKG